MTTLNLFLLVYGSLSLLATIVLFAACRQAGKLSQLEQNTTMQSRKWATNPRLLGQSLPEAQRPSTAAAENAGKQRESPIYW
jgi:hypothetical protein